jgi:hypothetical protein
LHAVGELLRAAAQHGMGVAFEPDGEGWRISIRAFFRTYR